MEPNKVQIVTYRLQIPLLLLIAGLSGFCLGLLQPDLQIAVEGAQVISGIVEYPAQAPLYRYYVNIYTILHQGCALLLRLGVSERTLSFFLSGLMGMVSFQALALCIFAFSRNLFLATAFPFFILYADPSNWGSHYPVSIMNTAGTHGVFALSFPLLVVGLLGNECYRAGGFLLGLAPAIHPASGSFLCLTVLICLRFDRKNLDRYEGILQFMFLGLFITGLSLGYHLLGVHPGLTIFSNAYSDYMAAFVRYWDFHRRPMVLSLQFLLFMSCLFVSLLGLAAFRTTLPRAPTFLLRIFAVSSLLAGLSSFIHLLPPEKVPSFLLTLMPARMLSFSILGLPALLMGLLYLYKKYPLFELILTALVVLLFFFPGLSTYGLLIASSAFVLATGTAIHIGEPVLLGKLWMPLGWLRRLLFSLMIITTVTNAYLHWEENKRGMKDHTNDSLFLEVARGEGLLLTCSDLGLIQLRTRRPVLLDASILDILPYAPEAGPEMDRILKEIYGVDLFHPPADIPPHLGALWEDTGKALWEKRSPEEWSQIRRKFHVTNVLTYAYWHLQLPVVIRDGELALYQIPPDG